MIFEFKLIDHNNTKMIDSNSILFHNIMTMSPCFVNFINVRHSLMPRNVTVLGPIFHNMRKQTQTEQSFLCY